jgi:hypothetical protein
VQAQVADAVEVAGVDEEVDTTVGQVCALTIFVSKVTAAPKPNTPPSEVAPVVIVTAAAARIFPAK